MRGGGARAARMLLALAACGALAGCTLAPGPQATPTPTTLPAGITVEFLQLRSDVAQRQAQIEITNGTSKVLKVGDLQMDDPRFDGPAARMLHRTSTLVPGQVADIRIQLPAMACPGSDTASSTVTLAYALGDASGTVTVPVAERFPVLADLHRRECLAAAVAETATVSLAEFRASSPGVPGDLVLSIVPTGRGQAARLDEIYETNLLSFTDPDSAAISYPIDLAVRPDSAAQTVHLPIVPARCDPHAVQEDKRGTVFDLAVEVDGASGQIPLAAPEDMRARILTWVTQWCREG